MTGKSFAPSLILWESSRAERPDFITLLCFVFWGNSLWWTMVGMRWRVVIGRNTILGGSELFAAQAARTLDYLARFCYRRFRLLNVPKDDGKTHPIITPLFIDLLRSSRSNIRNSWITKQASNQKPLVGNFIIGHRIRFWKFVPRNHGFFIGDL